MSIPDTTFAAPEPPSAPQTAAASPEPSLDGISAKGSASQAASANEHAQFRNQIGTISRQSGVFFAGTLFTAAAGYFFKIYVARMLGASALGVYALGLTIVGFLGVFNGLGLPQAATRFVAAYSATGQWPQLHVFLRRMSAVIVIANVLLGGVVVLAGPWLAVHVYKLPALVPYLPLFAALLAIGGVTAFCGQILAGYKDVAIRTVVTNFIASPLNILLGVVLLNAGFALRGYLVAQVGTAATVLVLLIAIAWRMTPREARRAPRSPVVLEKEVFWFSAAALGVSLLEFVLGQTDKILMGVFLNVKEVGIYATAATMVAFVPVVLQSVNQIFSPTIADLHARGERALLGRLFQTLTKWVIGLTLPLAVVLMIDSKALMLLFGPAFVAGWGVLIVGTLGQLVNTGVGSVGYLLLMSGNQGRLVRVQMMMAVFVIAATLLLVRPFGMIGVALAAAMTNALTNWLLLREVRTRLRISPYNRTYFHLIVPAAASLAVALAVKFLSEGLSVQWFWIAVTLALSYCAFGGAALVFGLDDDDKMIVSAIRNRLRGAVGKTPSFT